MENSKPDFSWYFKIQSEPSYQLTGNIKDDKTGSIYSERNYARMRCVADFVLLMAGLAVILLGFCLISKAVSPLYAPHTGAYDPNIGVKVLLRRLLTGSSTLISFFIIMPVLMKILRRLFSLRWIFVKFARTDALEGAGRHKSEQYFEYYNNIASFRCDRLFFCESKKFKGAQDDYFEKLNIYGRSKRLAGFYKSIIITLFWFSGAFMSTGQYSLIIAISYCGLILLYGLSHAFTYCSWKKIRLADAKEISV